MAAVRPCRVFQLVVFAVLLQRSSEKSISSSNSQALDSKDICSLPIKPGPCEAYFPKWGYSTRSGKCQEFIYGNCDGNKNNFGSKRECDIACSQGTKHVLKDAPPTGPCLLAKTQAEEKQLIGAYSPQCDANGFYKQKQCWASTGTCWCVDRYGSKVGEVNPNTQTCDDQSDSNAVLQSDLGKAKPSTKRILQSECLKQLQETPVIMVHGEPVIIKGIHVPTCNTTTGLFVREQCDKAGCWCVDEYSGERIKNTNHTKGVDFICQP